MVLRKLASQTAVYGISTMVGRFLNFLLVPLYTAKLAAVSDYGEVNVIFGYASFLAVVFTYGMETGFFNFARSAEKPAKVFSTAVIALSVSGILLLLFGDLFATPLIAAAGYAGKEQYIYWFTAILAADAISSLFFAWLRFQEKPWSFATLRLTNIGVNVLLNLFFILLCPWLLQHDHEWVRSFYNEHYTVQYIFISNLVASVMVLPLFGSTWRHIKEGFDSVLFRKMLRYSLPLVIVGLAGMVNETLDRILLKHLLPENIADHEVGIYGAFYKLSMVMTLFVQAFRFAAEPFFFKHSHQEDAQHTYAYVLKWFVYVCCGIYLLTMIFLPWLGPLLIRNQAYFADPRGFVIVPVLLMANLCLGVYYNLSTWYKLSNKTGMGAGIALAGAAITLIGNFYGIPRWGFEASAWTTLAAYASMVVMGYILGQKHFPIPYETVKISGIILFTALCGWFISQQLGETYWIAGMAIPVFLLFLWLLERKPNAGSQNHKQQQ